MTTFKFKPGNLVEISQKLRTEIHSIGLRLYETPKMNSYLKPGDLVKITRPNTGPRYWITLKDVEEQNYKNVVNYYDIMAGDVGMVIEGPQHTFGYGAYIVSVKGHFIAIDESRIEKL